MSNLVMVLGKSGSGKSTSLRNFAPDEVGVFSVAGKRLPFKGDLPVVQHADYKRIADVMAATWQHVVATVLAAVTDRAVL